MTSNHETPISIPFPQTEQLQLRIKVGACQIRIRPGAGDSWVMGTYRDPSGQIPLSIETDGSVATLGHPRSLTNLVGMLSGVPELDLTLGNTQPYALIVEAGGSENSADLTGLPLTQFVVRQGAGRSEISLSAVNPQPMDLLQLSAGAGSIQARGLAFANAAVMTLEGGAADYNFDFSGLLKRDANVKISTGVSSVLLTIPATTAAQVSSESLLSRVDVGDGFTKRAGAYWTPAAVEGQTPVLHIDSAVAFGMLTLRTPEQATSPGPMTVTPEPA